MTLLLPSSRPPPPGIRAIRALRCSRRFLRRLVGLLLDDNDDEDVRVGASFAVPISCWSFALRHCRDNSSFCMCFMLSSSVWFRSMTLTARLVPFLRVTCTMIGPSVAAPCPPLSPPPFPPPTKSTCLDVFLSIPAATLPPPAASSKCCNWDMSERNAMPCRSCSWFLC